MFAVAYIFHSAHICLSYFQDLSNGSPVKGISTMFDTTLFEWNVLQAHERNSYSRDQIESFQESRLQDLLGYIKHRSPWYQEYLRGIDIDSITLSNYNELIPAMTKKELMSNWDKIVTDPYLKLDDIMSFLIDQQGVSCSDYIYRDTYHVLSTSGSTGTPGVYVYNSEEWSLYCSQYYRYPRDYQDMCVVNITSVSKLFSLPKSLASVMSEDDYITIDPCIANNEIAMKLNRLQPNMIIILPSYLSRILDLHINGLLTIDPQVIVTGAEPLHPFLRSRVSDCWPHCKVQNNYGGSEGFAALSPLVDGCMHINEDFVIFEYNDNGSFYMTNLFAKSLPILRYHIEDRLDIFHDTKCLDCGSSFLRINEPQGRCSDTLAYGNSFINSVDLINVMNHFPNLGTYQIYQLSRGLELRHENLSDLFSFKQIKSALFDFLVNSGVDEPLIVISSAKPVRQPSGKLRLVVPLS